MDCITSSFASKEKNISFVENPSGLTDISIAVKKFIKSKPQKKFLIIDDVQTFLIYNRLEQIIKFNKSLTVMSAESDLKVVMLTTGLKDEDLTKNILPFFDKVIEKK
mgnify:CR=1 FL=1